MIASMSYNRLSKIGIFCAFSYACYFIHTKLDNSLYLLFLLNTPVIVRFFNQYKIEQESIKEHFTRTIQVLLLCYWPIIILEFSLYPKGVGFSGWIIIFLAIPLFTSVFALFIAADKI